MYEQAFQSEYRRGYREVRLTRLAKLSQIAAEGLIVLEKETEDTTLYQHELYPKVHAAQPTYEAYGKKQNDPANTGRVIDVEL